MPSHCCVSRLRAMHCCHTHSLSVPFLPCEAVALSHTSTHFSSCLSFFITSLTYAPLFLAHSLLAHSTNRSHFHSCVLAACSDMLRTTMRTSLSRQQAAHTQDTNLALLLGSLHSLSCSPSAGTRTRSSAILGESHLVARMYCVYPCL